MAQDNAWMHAAFLHPVPLSDTTGGKSAAEQPAASKAAALVTREQQLSAISVAVKEAQAPLLARLLGTGHNAKERQAAEVWRRAKAKVLPLLPAAWDRSKRGFNGELRQKANAVTFRDEVAALIDRAVRAEAVDSSAEALTGLIQENLGKWTSEILAAWAAASAALVGSGKSA